MKIKHRHRRDFWAYVRFNRLMNGRYGGAQYFCPDTSVFARGDVDAVYCFVEFDSTGEMTGQPRQPRLLRLAIDGKKLINWHIEQWVEGLVDGTLIAWDIRNELFALPYWVCEALCRQRDKVLTKSLPLV